VTQLQAHGGVPYLDGERFMFNFNGVHVIEAGADHRLTTTGDNVQRDFLRARWHLGLAKRRHVGDRVVWIDQRSSVNRVVMADVADLSQRVLTRSVDERRGRHHRGAGRHRVWQ